MPADFQNDVVDDLHTMKNVTIDVSTVTVKPCFSTLALYKINPIVAVNDHKRNMYVLKSITKITYEFNCH